MKNYYTSLLHISCYNLYEGTLFHSFYQVQNEVKVNWKVFQKKGGRIKRYKVSYFYTGKDAHIRGKIYLRRAQ
jgi:hypothetical protein